ncbi:MAG TPA: transposase [Vicinamibacterales bacterium]|nr:transposase [Vicinamibacterales bacterium]
MSAHVYNRGNNRMGIFTQDADCDVFLRILAAAAECHGASVHAFVVMTTHYHLIATPNSETAMAGAMKQLGERYTRYFNRKYGRTGTIWEGRYRAKHLLDERQWLICLRYVEQNPVRAGMVATPDAHYWSSYRAHGLGAVIEWLVPHELYLGLGATDEERRAAHRAICADPLPDADLDSVRNCWTTLKPNPVEDESRHERLGVVVLKSEFTPTRVGMKSERGRSELRLHSDM